MRIELVQIHNPTTIIEALTSPIFSTYDQKKSFEKTPVHLVEMASQTLRPHRSPSPSPSPSSTPVNPINPAKLTRQSLGPPPTASAGAARGFGGLGISPPSYPHPRHVSSSVALGLAGNGVKESLSPRPSLGTPGSRGFMPNSGRPSSEFLPGGVGREAKTPEGE